jgi:hypothetical protein
MTVAAIQSARPAADLRVARAREVLTESEDTPLDGMSAIEISAIVTALEHALGGLLDYVSEQPCGGPRP